MVCCSIANCRNSSTTCSFTNKGITFHSFPQDPDVKAKWISATGKTDWYPTNYSRVCSVHFNDEDFKYTIKRRNLNKSAIPTINIWKFVTGNPSDDRLTSTCEHADPYVSTTHSLKRAFQSVDDANLPSTSQEAMQLRRNVRSKKKCLYDSSSESSDDNDSRTSRNLDEHQRTAKIQNDADCLDYKVTVKLEPEDDEEEKDASYFEDKKTESPFKSVNKSSITSNRPGNMPFKSMHSIAPLLQNVSSYLESLTNKSDDFFDSFGKYVATMLRSMPKRKAMKLKPQIIEIIISYSLSEEEDIKLEQDIKIEQQDS